MWETHQSTLRWSHMARWSGITKPRTEEHKLTGEVGLVAVDLCGSLTRFRAGARSTMRMTTSGVPGRVLDRSMAVKERKLEMGFFPKMRAWQSPSSSGGERRLRQWPRQERMTVAMTLSEAYHHTMSKLALKKVVEAEKYSAPRGLQTERAETHDAPQAQKKGDVEVAQAISPEARSKADGGAHRQCVSAAGFR